VVGGRSVREIQPSDVESGSDQVQLETVGGRTERRDKLRSANLLHGLLRLLSGRVLPDAAEHFFGQLV
jgi:hypothetical protein